jgi:hypothetical protein
VSTPRRFLPLLAALAFALLAVGISACGSEESNHVNEGEPVRLGELEYNVTFSRYLNPSDPEDAAYLVGQAKPPPGETYFGIFFEVRNESHEAHQLPAEMTVTDADGEEYEVLPSESLFALQLGATVSAEEQVPELDSPAQMGPIEGSVAIVLLPDEASANRPLTLHIPGEEGEGAEVTLDL